MDELTANEGTVPRAASDSGRGVTGRTRRAGQVPHVPQPSPAQGSSPTPSARPSAKQGPGPGAGGSETRRPAPPFQPHSHRGPASRRRGDAAVRARNSRENTSGPAHTFVGDTGKERKFRRAQRAGVTRSPTPAPSQRRQCAGARPLSFLPVCSPSPHVSGRWVLCHAGPSGG